VVYDISKENVTQMIIVFCSFKNVHIENGFMTPFLEKSKITYPVTQRQIPEKNGARMRRCKKKKAHNSKFIIIWPLKSEGECLDMFWILHKNHIVREPEFGTRFFPLRLPPP
jgi:hypothetical protein